MITALSYRTNFDGSVFYALLLSAALVAMVSATAAVATALAPVVYGCCVSAAPVVGQLLFGIVLIYAFAMATKPRGA